MTLTLAATALLSLWSTPTTTITLEGEATYYAAGVMETVAKNRAVDLAGYAGAVALNRAGDLYRVVWLERSAGLEEPTGLEEPAGLAEPAVTGPYLVIDCAQYAHFEAREARGYIVEVDYQTATDWGMVGVGPIPVRVHFEKPGGTHAPPRHRRSRPPSWN